MDTVSQPADYSNKIKIFCVQTCRKVIKAKKLVILHESAVIFLGGVEHHTFFSQSDVLPITTVYSRSLKVHITVEKKPRHCRMVHTFTERLLFALGLSINTSILWLKKQNHFAFHMRIWECAMLRHAFHSYSILIFK